MPIRSPESPTKILHVVSDDSWGGAERVLSLLINETIRAPDLECEVVTLNEGRLARELRSCGVRVSSIPEEGRSFRSLVRTLRSVIRERSPDVLHAHRYKEILLCASARQRQQGWVVTVHGLEPWHQLTMRERGRVWPALAAARLSKAHFVAVSDEVRSRLARALAPGPRLRHIPNPMPEATLAEPPLDLRSHFSWHRDAPLVGFVGRLERVKGPDRFLDVAAESAGDARFVLIGGGSLEPEVRTEISRRHLDPRVALVGQVEDAMSLMPQLDVLALTSRHEGLPMVLLEAAATGLPVVAFEVGGVGQLLDGGPAAVCVPPGDIRRFRSELDRVLGDRRASRAAAVRWADQIRGRYSAESVLDAYRDVYREVAAAGRGNRP